MAKLAPEIRWRRNVLERYNAFRQSSEFLRLRSIGLAALKRPQLLSSKDWWEGCGGLMRSQDYIVFQEECRRVGEHFGLAQWAIESGCLLKNYDPEKQPFVIESDLPWMRVVTESNNRQFLSWLLFEARKLGVYVDQQQGSSRIPIICVPFPTKPK